MATQPNDSNRLVSHLPFLCLLSHRLDQRKSRPQPQPGNHTARWPTLRHPHPGENNPFNDVLLKSYTEIL